MKSKEVLIMEPNVIMKVSVRNLVEFVLQSGDLCQSYSGSTRMADGIKAHQTIQKSMGEEYLAEVPVLYKVIKEDFILEVSGRIDGIIKTRDTVIIDEIKTTVHDVSDIDINFNPLHLAQAKCYAYIYSASNNIANIGVQLTYYNMGTNEIQHIINYFKIEELRDFFDDLTGQYIEYAYAVREWEKKRNSSISELKFPFSIYREGQRKFAVAVYNTIVKNTRLFAQAPTGIGKTIAALFPAVKALGGGFISRIFYLTPKTITRTAAEKALEGMRNKGLIIKTLTLTAKDKICFNKDKECGPKECEFARGYYDRIKDAVQDAISIDSLTPQVVQDYARKHSVCPFELSLDLSLLSDCIICDYNYAFDPRVYLKRFFLDSNEDYCFLVDEAHNLVDRSREMFSAELYKKPILELKNAAKNKNAEIMKSLKGINNYFIKLRKCCEENESGNFVEVEKPGDIIPLLRKFIKASDDYLTSGGEMSFYRQLLDVYFDITSFLRIYELYDEKYTTYVERLGNDIRIKIFCVDPSTAMKAALNRGKSVVFFSATLAPLDYFIQIFGCGKESFKFRLQSPFPSQNLCVLVDDKISTRFKSREHSYDRVSEAIYSLVSEKTGNYLIFFPSYKYMNQVHTRFQEKNPGINTICQMPSMPETKREDFLNMFASGDDHTLVGFAVMGGLFGEGIDLVGDRLLGAAIVGVGLPQICLERDIIKDYFERERGSGFQYAYIYPGMNRVLQAAGRVIRSENDRGVVLLMDDRFTNPPYRELLPKEWNIEILKDFGSFKNAINKFWHES